MANDKPRLEQLDGFRFLVAFWLVIAHNFDGNSGVGTLYEKFCVRRYVAVQFFIVLSGFVSHYAYADRDFSTSTTLRKFYVGRYGSILACYYATMVLAYIIRGAGGQLRYTTPSYLAVAIPLSAFLLQCWLPKYAYVGNTPAWTLSTLSAHWFAYPFCQPLLKRSAAKTLFILSGVIPVLAIIPSIVALILTSGQLKKKMWYAFYTHPILRFPDFLYGSVLAEIFARGHRPSLLAKVSDLALPVVFLLILSVPFHDRTSSFDTLMIQAPMHLFGLLIYGSSCDPCGSFIGKFMAMKPCRQLGDFAFQVYLWRWPLFAVIQWMELGYYRHGWMKLSVPVFLPSIVILHVIAYLWYSHVDTPIRKYLSSVTTPRTDLATELVGEGEKGEHEQTMKREITGAPNQGTSSNIV